MFNLISFSPHFIDHVSFYFHLIYFINIHIYHIWLHSYYIVIQLYCQFHFSANPVLKINYPQVSLDQVLILDRYSLLEAELRWFYYSLFLYIKWEIQQKQNQNVDLKSFWDWLCKFDFCRDWVSFFYCHLYKEL